MNARLERANLLIELRRHAEAEQEARDALGEDPENPWAYTILARALIALNRPDEAERHAGIAIGINPSFAYAFYVLCIAHWNQRDAARPLAIAEAIRLDSQNAEYYSTRGRLMLAVGYKEAALVALERSLALDPRHVDSLSYRAEIVADFHPAEASRNLEQALAVDPENAATHLDRGKLLLRLWAKC